MEYAHLHRGGPQGGPEGPEIAADVEAIIIATEIQIGERARFGAAVGTRLTSMPCRRTFPIPASV